MAYTKYDGASHITLYREGAWVVDANGDVPTEFGVLKLDDASAGVDSSIWGIR